MVNYILTKIRNIFGIMKGICCIFHRQELNTIQINLLVQMMFIHVVDIVTSDISHVTKLFIYLYVIHVIYVMLYVCLHSAKHMMRYDPERIATRGCKLHV